MIEKADSGRNFRRAGSVEVDFQSNLGFLGVALDRRRSRHFTFSYCNYVSILFSRRRFPIRDAPPKPVSDSRARRSPSQAIIPRRRFFATGRPFSRRAVASVQPRRRLDRTPEIG